MTIAGSEKQTLLDRFHYYENNKADILKDLETMSQKAVRIKYGIPASTFYCLHKRWGFETTRLTVSKNPDGSGVPHTAMPAEEQLRLQYLEGYYAACEAVFRIFHNAA